MLPPMFSALQMEGHADVMGNIIGRPPKKRSKDRQHGVMQRLSNHAAIHELPLTHSHSEVAERRY